VNHVHAEFAGAFEVQRAVIDEHTLVRGPLGNPQSDAEDELFGLARMHITGTEEDLEVPAKLEGLDAIFIELQGLVVDGADEVFAGAGDFIEDGSRLRVLPGLREHEGSEIFAGKRARPIEQSAIEIFVERDVAGIESREAEFVAILEFVPVELKGFGGGAAGIAVPPIGKDNASNVPEQRVDFGRFCSTSGGGPRARILTQIYLGGEGGPPIERLVLWE